MSGPKPELVLAVAAAWARLKLGTLKQAEIKTGIERTTLHRLRHGIAPSYGMVVRWAMAIGESVNRWLSLAGYEALPESADTGQKLDAPSPAPSGAVAVPPEVSEAIQEALARGDVDTAVDEAWWYVRRPEHRRILNFRAGAMAGDQRPGKIAVVRAFEAIAGVQLLPPDILF